MTMIMTRLQRLLRSRQLHTIISQETIKPSSPTPTHFKTHNLSLIDQLNPSVNMPLIFFYKNYNGDINNLKKSLSQTLTSYYPFTGRLIAPSVPQIECNDQGVEFWEASIDSRLSDFNLKKELDETIDQLIPNYALGNNPNLVEVQLNHFTCGGAAVVVSTSHKIADGFTMANFINHWATVTRGGSPKNPTFLSYKGNIIVPEYDDYKGTDKVKYATRRFMFPNSKLNELKKQVKELVNPTRIEILSSLIFKCAVGAATTSSGSFQPSNLYQVVNMRKIIRKSLPEIAAGNIFTVAVAKMPDSGEIKLNEVIAKLRKEMMEIKQASDVEEVGRMFANTLSTSGGDQIRSYIFSSLCRFPFYEVDFGWGKPVQVLLRNGVIEGRAVIFMDTPSGEGIEAIVQLGKEEMAIFQKNKEILACSQDI